MLARSKQVLDLKEILYIIIETALKMKTTYTKNKLAEFRYFFIVAASLLENSLCIRTRTTNVYRFRAFITPPALSIK